MHAQYRKTNKVQKYEIPIVDCVVFLLTWFWTHDILRVLLASVRPPSPDMTKSTTRRFSYNLITSHAFYFYTMISFFPTITLVHDKQPILTCQV